MRFQNRSVLLGILLGSVLLVLIGGILATAGSFSSVQRVTNTEPIPTVVTSSLNNVNIVTVISTVTFNTLTEQNSADRLQTTSPFATVGIAVVTSGPVTSIRSTLVSADDIRTRNSLPTNATQVTHGPYGVLPYLATRRARVLTLTAASAGTETNTPTLTPVTVSEATAFQRVVLRHLGRPNRFRRSDSL